MVVGLCDKNFAQNHLFKNTFAQASDAPDVQCAVPPGVWFTSWRARATLTRQSDAGREEKVPSYALASHLVGGWNRIPSGYLT